MTNNNDFTMTEGLWAAFSMHRRGLRDLPLDLRDDLRRLCDDLVKMPADELLDFPVEAAHWWADGLPSPYSHAAIVALSGMHAREWSDLMDEVQQEGVYEWDAKEATSINLWKLWAAAYVMTAERWADDLAATLRNHLDDLVEGELGLVASALLDEMPAASVLEVLTAAADVLAPAAA